MAELFNAYAQGVQLGQQQRRQREQRNQLAELQALAPQVIGGNLQAINRAYALDPQTAQTYQQEGNRQQQQLLGLAKTLKQSAGNPQMQAGVYRSAVPFLRSSFGDGIPDEFDAAVVMPVVDQLLAVSANTPTLGAQTPTDVRSFQMMTQGLSAEDTERARRINLGLDGRASTSGFSQVKFTGADGRERLGVLNGRTGQIDLPDGTSFNPQTGAISQTAGTQQGAALPAAQATVFRAPNGEVIDVSQVTEPGLRESIMQNPEQWGLVPDGGSAQLPPRNVQPAQAGGGMFVGRAPEDQAAATEAAKLGAQMQYLPQELEMRTNAAIRQSAGIEQNKTAQERASAANAKSAQLNNVDRGLTRIEAAMKGLQGRFVDTGPIDGRLMVSTPQGQELEAAVGAIQNDMLALTRVPGVGSQSDLEQKIANLKYPSIYNAPQVNARNVEQLKQFMADLRRQIQGSGGVSAGNAGPAAGAVEDGYRFRGGNPADPNNWERL